MSETGFAVFNDVFGIVSELLYAACLALFLRPFLRSRGRRWRLALIFVFYLLSVPFALHPAIPQGFSGLVLTVMLTAAAGVLNLERPTAFLLAIFYWNTRTSGGLITESPYFLLDSLRPAPNQPPEAAYLRAAVLVTLFLLVNIVLMAVMLYALQRRMRKQKLPLHGWELCYLSLIPVTGILFGQIVSRLWLEFEDGAFLLLYERHPAFLAVVPVLALLFYGGAYLAVVFQQRMAALQEEQATHYVEYPHYLLYQDGDKAKETLENWQPTGSNPFYGSIDGRFTAPKEIRALGSVPPGSKAVVIHPKLQERMEQDPAYAREIFAKIDTWFAFDAARNEAIMPGCTAGMSQAVAIGEDGNICNACSSSAGGEITYSKSGSDDEESWWDLRMARHAEFMKLAVEKQIQRHLQASDLLAAAAAKSRLAGMMNSGNLQAIFGDEIAGIPTETVLAITQSQVWGGGAIL